MTLMSDYMELNSVWLCGSQLIEIYNLTSYSLKNC